MGIRARLGLASALALLAACGPAKPTADAGDEGDSGDSNDSAEGSNDEGPAGTCTFENYADDPQRLGFTELGCFPAAPDGSCAECDLECMESIVYDCPLYDVCREPDVPCFSTCYDHRVLCSEQLGDQCCHLVTARTTDAVPGRPLRERGVMLLPSLRVSGSAADQPGTCAAAAYREFARYERASVDAFDHAARVLAQLGAPLTLIERHHTAAGEEAEHASLALAAARALDGRDASLGELPRSSLELEFELASFVRDLVTDGCIGEWVAAREAAWALEQAAVREREDLLCYWTAVADEEAEHANLAWATLEWLLAARPELGGVVQAALADALSMRSQGCCDGAEALGIASSTTRAGLREHALAELIADARAVA